MSDIDDLAGPDQRLRVDDDVSLYGWLQPPPGRLVRELAPFGYNPPCLCSHSPHQDTCPEPLCGCRTYRPAP